MINTGLVADVLFKSTPSFYLLAYEGYWIGQIYEIKRSI